MIFGKRHRAYIRDLPRLRSSGQLKRVEGCGEVYVEGREALADFIASLRKGDIAVVVWLHVLAPPRKTTNARPRDDLWDAITRIEAKGASVWEVETGRHSVIKDDRDGMIRDAIEALTSAGRARASRANGRKSAGRPPHEIDPKEREHAASVWHDVRYPSDRAAMAAGPKGWTRYRYEKLFKKSGRGR